MPAPGLIIQALNSIQETNLPPDGVNFPEEVARAITSKDPPTDAQLGKSEDTILFPKASALQAGALHLMPAKDFAKALVELAKTPDPAKAWVERDGSIIGAMTWEGARAGNRAEVDAQMVHIRMVPSAAAWCRTATQSTNGWPVNVMAMTSMPADAP